MRRGLTLWAFVAVVGSAVARDRSWLFFLLLLPVLIMVVIGISFTGDDRLVVGLHAEDRSPAAVAIERAVRDAEGFEVRDYDDREALADAVRGGGVAAGVLVPRGLGAAVEAGRRAELRVLSVATDESALTIRATVQGVLDRVGAPLVAARLVAERSGASFAETLGRAEALARGGASVKVEEVRDRPGNLSRFSFTAPQNLVLFVFLNGLTAAIMLVDARRSGVLRRMLSTPASPGLVVLGLALGWLALAIAQSLLLVAIGALAFGVSWGSAPAAAALIVVFALVGAGGGMLVGAIGRDSDRVGATAPIIGIVLAALGGCMVPLEVFPDAMRAVAHAVPHSWAVTAWEELIFDGGGIGDIAPNLAVLLGFAAAMLAAGAAVLRRELRA